MPRTPEEFNDYVANALSQGDKRMNTLTDEITAVNAGTGTKSAKYSVVNLKMLKALQEAMARIETEAYRAWV